MAHYFDSTNTKSYSGTYSVIFQKRCFDFNTDHGVFSKQHLDEGSKLLIEGFIKTNPENLNCLDLGCGIGVIGIVCNTLSPSLKFDYVDVNERAVKLTTKNLEKNNLKGNVYLSDCLDSVLDKTYDIVISNPPIRAGNAVFYNMFNQSYEVLNKGGKLIVVLRFKQGAKTYIKKISELFGNSNILEKDKGFVVCEFTK